MIKTKEEGIFEEIVAKKNKQGNKKNGKK